MFHIAISYTLSEYSVACHERFVTRSDEDLVGLSPIASVQTSGNLISARGHYLSKIAFVIAYCFSAVCWTIHSITLYLFVRSRFLEIYGT